MWFDVAAALAEVAGGENAETEPGPRASRANRANPDPPNSTNSTVSTPPKAATPSRPEPAPSATGAETRHGESPGGRLLTWTGRVVSLEEWRRLTDWDRHGPDGRTFCGCCQAWVPPETARAHAEVRRAEWRAAQAATAPPDLGRETAKRSAVTSASSGGGGPPRQRGGAYRAPFPGGWPLSS